MIRAFGTGRFFWRGLALGVAAALFLWSAGSASAHLSSIVIDAESGQVVSQHDADSPNFPASLTKMMTLYLVFEALEQGKLTLDQHFTVSEHAAAQAPSKLGLKPGESVALKDLILAVVTHSANDAAVVIAEGMAGTESAFAARMTEKARSLGMSNTIFRNASGLPNSGQFTTARDLATLALALYRNFPKQYGYFSTEEFTFNGVTYANHNHLMSSFPGMDGIKTGYIRASGFNLAASAVRNNRRLIAVIMGGESAHSRDQKMAQLLNTAFAQPAGAPVEVADDEDATDSSDSLAHRAGRAIAALSPVARAEAATAAAAPRPHLRHARHTDSGWAIQVGAFTQHAAAAHAAEQSLARLPAYRNLAVLIIAPVHADKEHLFRARIVHFSEREAEVACRVLHQHHKTCAVVAPEARQLALK